MALHLLDVLPHEADLTGTALAQQSRDGAEGRSFSSAVAADEGDDLPLVHVQGNALNGVDLSVIKVVVHQFQHFFRH